MTSIRPCSSVSSTQASWGAMCTLRAWPAHSWAPPVAAALVASLPSSLGQLVLLFLPLPGVSAAPLTSHTQTHTEPSQGPTARPLGPPSEIWVDASLTRDSCILCAAKANPTRVICHHPEQRQALLFQRPWDTFVRVAGILGEHRGKGLLFNRRGRPLGQAPTSHKALIQGNRKRFQACALANLHTLQTRRKTEEKQHESPVCVLGYIHLS